MSIGAISAISAAGTDSLGAGALGGISMPLTTGAGLGTDAVSATGGVDFAGALAGGLEKLDAVQKKADGLAVQAATGDLKDVHDYTMAATQAELTTELTVTLRNKALDAFGEIMRMQG